MAKFGLVEGTAMQELPSVATPAAIQVQNYSSWGLPGEFAYMSVNISSQKILSFPIRSCMFCSRHDSEPKSCICFFSIDISPGLKN